MPLASIAVMSSAAAAAEPSSNPSLTKDWVFEAGAIFQHLDGDATSEGSLTGGRVRFAQIGLEGTETVPYLAMRWRFADDWRFDFNFTSLDASGRKSNDSLFEFGHGIFDVGYQLTAPMINKSIPARSAIHFLKTVRRKLVGALV